MPLQSASGPLPGTFQAAAREEWRRHWGELFHSVPRALLRDQLAVLGCPPPPVPPPSADFKLVFGSPQGRPSSNWHGSTATIVQSPGDEVWGIVWKMNTSNLNSLDKQEGVEDGIYVPIEVNIHTQEGKVLTCRSYQMIDCVCDLPSPHYKKVICMGAKQNGLPIVYQKKLEAIETNNYAGPVSIFEEIEAAIKEKKTTTQ